MRKEGATPVRGGDFCSNRKKKLPLFRNLDVARIFRIGPAVRSKVDERSGLGAAPKDQLRDRLVIIRTPRNSVELRLLKQAS